MQMTKKPSWLPVTSALNLRDAGGAPVMGGGHVRPGVLLRSGSLRFLTDEDARTLVGRFGVRTVADLRTPGELTSDGPSALARIGVETVHLPLISDVDAALVDTESESAAIVALADVYQAFVELRGEHLVTLARLLTEPRTGSVLVHCAAGKDRTGVAVAILLAAVGVEWSAILDDYIAINEVITEVLTSLATGTGRADWVSRIPLAARVAQPSALDAVLDRRDHAGAAGWLRSKGLDDTELDLLRLRMVE
jgi:protein tyrosine/serine phosphatase